MIARNFKGTPLYVQGQRDNGLGKNDLDKISRTVPILVRHADYHGATVNSRLLELLGIASETGVLLEAEAQLAVDSFPPPDQAQLEEFIRHAIKTLHAFGITGGHSDDLHYFGGFNRTLKAFETVLEDTPFRAHLIVHHQELDQYVAAKRPWLDQSPYLQLGAVKLFYDGTISSKTALMRRPYRGSAHYGQRILPRDQLLTLIKKIRSHRLPLAIHTIGDQALAEVADLLSEYPVAPGLHDRIIHASFAHPDTIEKLRRLPVIFDVQPQFVGSDLPWAYGLFEQAPHLIYPWKTYLDNGLVLAGGSDAPVEIPNPLLGMQESVLRMSKADRTIQQQKERLPITQAIALYTEGANVPTYDAHRGKIAIGHIADFTVLDADLTTTDPEQWHRIKVMLTVIDEKIVYRGIPQ